MTLAFATAVFNAPVDVVWKRVRDFGDLSWHPAIASCGLEVGPVGEDGVAETRRRIVTRGGEVIVERLEAFDDVRHRYSYSFTQNPFGVQAYRATLEFIPVTADDTTFAHWRTEFTAAEDRLSELSNLFSHNIFQAGLHSLDALISEIDASPGLRAARGIG
ncbi:SRPBCC family protein [Nocardia sp. NPDC057668]|uniref:SRPBCC family protein n=1 Tax=Nocardia sp. NPDC057668 TaxID=3346202 RepID=UPI003673186B